MTKKKIARASKSSEPAPGYPTKHGILSEHQVGKLVTAMVEKKPLNPDKVSDAILDSTTSILGAEYGGELVKALEEFESDYDSPWQEIARDIEVLKELAEDNSQSSEYRGSAYNTIATGLRTIVKEMRLLHMLGVWRSHARAKAVVVALENGIGEAVST